MNQQSQLLSVMDVAGICGVARSTVSYWIAKKSLSACRIGKKHMISVKDLVTFLEFEGHKVPKTLLENTEGIYQTAVKPFKTCWEYWANDFNGDCGDCIVYTNSISACFTSKNNNDNRCRINCSECRYFYEYYSPAVSFIHQIRNPAAIYKDMYIWSANKAWADLCVTPAKSLIGAGVEEFIHSESLINIINYDKQIRMGNSSEVFRFTLFFTNKSSKKIKTDLIISPLKNPEGTWLAVVERQYKP